MNRRLKNHHNLKLSNQYNLTLAIWVLSFFIGSYCFAQNSRGNENFTIFGDTLFQGKWSARGISNQGGPVAFAEYNGYDSSYSFITSEGYIFKTKESAIDWKILNPQNKFDNPVGYARYPKSGKSYINVITRDGFLYHSSNDGKSWSTGTGLQSIEGFSTVQKMVQTGNGDVFLLLEEKLGLADITLYKSSDFGASFSKIKTFSTPIPLALNNYDISKPIGDDTSLLVLYVDTLSIYNSKKDSFVYHSRIPAFSFREGRVSGSFKNGILEAYLCRGGSAYKYDNVNLFWNRMSQISFESRTPNTFTASNTKINELFIGGTGINKSKDTAKTWSIQNSLNDFLQDKNSNLHPGINFIQSFQNVRQTEIFLIGTDGGLFLSQDHLNTVINLTSSNLQISNHYDLEILKNSDSKLYTSTQHQGLHVYKNYNPDSTINSEYIDWGTNYGVESSISENNLWAASTNEIGFISSLTDRFFRATWKFSDSLNLGASKIILKAHPLISTEAYCTGLYHKNDPDKKSYVYKLTYDGTDIVAEKMDKNFNLNFGKTEFISAFEIASTDDGSWYTITTEGNFYASIDSGNTWKRSAFFNGLFSNQRFGSTILASSNSEGLVYVGGKGNGNGSIYFSLNSGKDFNLLGSGLKNTEVHGISSANEDSLLFVSTRNGPFVYSEKFEKWLSLSVESLPNRDWTCVQTFEKENTVWFGTFGRGLWEFDYQFIKDSVKSIVEISASAQSSKLYPNPTSGRISIESDSEIISISIFSIDGKKIDELLMRNKTELNIRNLDVGVYYLQLNHENGIQSNHKVIKQ